MKLYTFSIVRNTFPEFSDKLPYVVGIVEREDGSRVAAYIEGYQEGMQIQIGMPMEPAGTQINGLEVFRFC